MNPVESMSVEEIKAELLGQFKGKTDKQIDAILNPKEPPNMKTQHTPTPWGMKLEKADKSYRIFDCVGGSVLAYSADQEDAEYIVRAVNCHEELLEACKKASEMVNYYRRAVMSGQIVGTHPGALVQDDFEVMDSLDKAIAKAEAL